MILSVLLVGAMGLALAHAPPSWQRPGPTALLFAVAGGVFIGGIAVVNRIKSRRLVFPVAFAVIALAIVGMTARTLSAVRQKSGRSAISARPRPPNPSALFENFPGGQVGQEMVREMRRKEYEAKRPFRVYLAFRLQALGITNEPWPLVYWIGELLLGGLLGAFVAVRWQKWQWESQPPPAKFFPIRSSQFSGGFPRACFAQFCHDEGMATKFHKSNGGGPRR